jgi:hypothetical protein
MIAQFYSHYWKGLIRNAAWRRNILTKIVFGILMLYLIMLFVYVGVSLDQILLKKGGNPVDTFNSFLIWYFVFDLLMRSMMQSLPVIQVIPYLRFKFRRATIIHYLLLKSLWNIFNFLPWLIIVPFCIRILPASGHSGIFYIVGILALVLINNFLALYFQYISQKKFLLSLIPMGIVALCFGLQNLTGHIGTVSIWLGNGLVNGNLILLIGLLLVLVLVYQINSRLLYNGFYLDEIKTKKGSDDRFARLPGMHIFDRLGLIGKYMALEANMLFRNKRPRQGLVMLPIFWAYLVFMMMKDADKFTSGAMGVYFLSILMGIGSIVYGQFLFSWESSYFDGISARKIDFLKYVLAKYYLMGLLVLISSVPLYFALVVFAHISPLLWLSLTLFVLGPIHFIVFYMGTFNDARVDLAMGQFFNYQGVKGKHFLVSFAFFLIPFFLYLLLNALIGQTLALWTLSLIGVLFFATHKYWIKAIVIKNFNSRKYKNLEGYRKLTA